MAAKEEVNEDLPFYKKPWFKWGGVGVATVGIVAMLIQGNSAYHENEKLVAEEVENSTKAEVPDNSVNSINGGTDEMLYRIQPDLEKEYGVPPEGFIWDQQGNPISLGVSNMSSEDVVYSFIRSLTTLDMGLAQKLSRGSTVVANYAGNFTEMSNIRTDYSEDLFRDVYKVGLLSLENKGVEDSAVFADNKRVYTVKGNMVDLTDKEFWLDDRDSLFERMYEADQSQSDTTQAQLIVNEYVTDYYSSSKAKTKDVTFSITVEKYPDLNSGWLVSLDSDLDALLSYTDGVPVNQHIMTEYRKYKQDEVLRETLEDD